MKNELRLIFADQKIEDLIDPIIFLAGPTPRSHQDVRSWRPEMIYNLLIEGFSGTILIPEDSSGKYRNDYIAQVNWETEGLEASHLILFWVPRSELLPGFTTNVEFGEHLSSGKIVYGRPDNAMKTKYLDYKYKKYYSDFGEPANSLRDLAVDTIARSNNLKK